MNYENNDLHNSGRTGNPRKTGGNAGKGGKEFQIENYPCGKRQRGRRAAVDGGYEPGAQQGAEMTVRVEGEDEEQAAEAMKAFLEANL